MTVCERLQREVVAAGICTGCGACVALDFSGASRMADTPWGPQPVFPPESAGLPEVAWTVCPGKGIDYAALYRAHYGRLPDNWLLGCYVRVRTGHSADPAIRRAGASGGVLTHTLIHLLETARIDAAVVVRQGVPTPLQARAVIARTRAELLAAAQSVYIPVSTLDLLRRFTPGARYAMVCLPDQAAALRCLQQANHPAACQVRYVLGPYTGTALYPAAIDCFLRAHRVRRDDPVTALQWRAGAWPGYLEIRTAGGRVLRSPKIYYNYLIPFFITQASRQGLDFTNEFCDLSVGDAWSPRFEGQGGGHSVLTTRTPGLEDVVQEMERAGLLQTEPEDPAASLAMHGHMLDFKKRGSYIRNRLRRRLGRAAPEYGLRPVPLPAARVAVEWVIAGLFFLGGTRAARWLLAGVPESVLGPLFNRLRLRWKGWSKPVKRRGLGALTMVAELPPAGRARRAAGA